MSVVGNSLILEDLVLVDQSFGSPPLQVHLFAGIDRAYATFQSPTLDFGLHIANGAVTEYHTIYEAEIALGCDMSVDVTALYAYDMPPRELYRKTVRKVNMVGIFPVYHKITTTATLKTHLELLGQLNTDITGMEFSQSTTIGARYQNSAWQDLNSVQLTLTPPTITMSAYAQAKLKPYIEVKVVDKLYSVAGPSLRAEPYIEGIASSQILVNYCLEVKAGCDVGCGFEGLGFLGMSNWSSPSFPVVSGTLYPKHCWPWPF